MSKKIILDVLWGVALVCGILLCLWGINLPYVGIDNANNNFLALASKNFLRFGYTTLHFLPTYYVGKTLPAVIPYYLHHPVLFFLLASVPFRLFGNANWVVHATNLVFVIASLFVLYHLVREAVNEEAARWTVVFAVLMPWFSFFWKYIFFEQSSLFFTLTTLYFCIRYWKSQRPIYLWGVGVAAFLGGATDWYGGYLAFGFLYLLFARSEKRIWPTFWSYALGEFLGLGTYFLALVLTGNVGAIWNGYSARGVTSELSAVSYWPLRLVAITILRLLIYGSPLLVVSLWAWLRRKGTVGKSLLWHVGVMLFIVGIINMVVMPSATWGLSYFLYYLVPFAALVCGVWVASIAKRSVALVYTIILIQLFWCFGVTALKFTQMTKQTWRYDFGRDVSHIVPRYQKVGVLEYPGDVLQNYFLIDALPMSEPSVASWVEHGKPSDIRYTVVSCKGTCTSEELAYLERVRQKVGVQEFRYGQNTGWLVDRESAANITKGSPAVTERAPELEPQRAPSGFLYWYRKVRDFLGSTQI